MTEETSPARRPGGSLSRTRERAVETLSGLFSDDELTVEELERRLDLCYRARSIDELEAVFADLPARLEVVRADTSDATARPDHPASRSREVAPDRDASGPGADRKKHDLVLAVMSGVRRRGRGTPPRHMNVLALMGGAELDFRQARFPPGETTINAVAFWGGVEIVVPPGLRVESVGLPLMGGFDRVDQDGDDRSHPDAVLKIRGVACMGGVEVSVRPPGE